MIPRLSRPGVLLVYLLSLWGMTGLLAGCLRGGPVTGANQTGSISEQLFGSARSLIGNRMVLEADRYFHQGVGHASERIALSELIMKWGDAIAPKQHTVLSGGDLEEIMPWFRFATKVDPENVDAYVTAAYWCVRSGHPDRAKRVLDEALAENPDDFRILLAMGHTLRQAGMTVAAEHAYRQGLQAWSTRSDQDAREMRVQMVELLLSLGSLCEERGDFDEAISCYASLRDRFPEHSGITERIAALQRGEQLGSPDFWGHAGPRSPCSQDHHQAHDGPCEHAVEEEVHHPMCADGCTHEP